MKEFFDKVLNVFLRFSDWRFALSSIILIVAVAVSFYVMFAFLKDKNGKKLIWIFTGYMLVGAMFFILSDFRGNVKSPVPLGTGLPIQRRKIRLPPV